MSLSAFVKRCSVVALSFAVPAVCLSDGPRTYERDVRPILKAHCFHCHGETGEKNGGLDLRLRRFIVQGGESGPAITAGNVEESLLLERVVSGEMPPGDDKQLSEREVATIREWIAAGAPTLEAEPESIGDGPIFTEAERNYWAFQPIRRPEIPSKPGTDRVRTAIDAFLVSEGASPHPGFAQDADREQLVRRASLNLKGLPPAPEFVAQVRADESPAWWDRAIEELLASPHYGERWGRHWLDVAGYADSEGYTDEDAVRNDAWRFRDYVIRSFNADKPFDRFVLEQLAGDEMVTPPYANLNEDQIEQLTATGFLRMAPDGTASGGVNQTEARNQTIADTLQIVGTSLLGMTVHCAQCHDHRYDPIPQVDYYRLRAVFEPALDWKNWRNPNQRRISLYTDADREQARIIEAEAVEVDRKRQAKADEYITRTLEEELLLIAEDLREPLRTAYRTEKKSRTEEQAKLLKEHPSVDNISVGSLYLYDRRRDERAAKIDAERKQKEKRFVDETRAAELAKVPEADRAAVEAALQAAVQTRTPEQTELLAKYPGTQVALATLAQFNAEAAAEIDKDKQQAAELRSSKAEDDLKRLADDAAAVRARKPVENFVRALSEIPGTVPATMVFHRGDPEQPKDPVSPGDLSILSGRPAIPDKAAGLPTTGRRLAFARQLTDGTHPLLPRVIVNRIWMHHFGRGLVNSLGDFGFLGERPSHPLLLDWLAAEFVDSGWSMKHLHRLIMSSTAYRQSSIADANGLAADPENRLYSRYPLRRLEAEILRDAMLAVSGKFNDKPFGAPIPVMEDSVGQIVLGMENLDGERKPVDKVDLKGEEFRRSIYVQVRRTRLLSMFETFDTPELSPTCERRNFSTVAPQSLFFMNSAHVVEAAEFLSDRLLREAPGGPESQVRLAWQLAFSAEPSSAEEQEACRLIDKEKALLRERQPKADAAEIDREALSIFCQAVLSSNRFLYVE